MKGSHTAIIVAAAIGGGFLVDHYMLGGRIFASIKNVLPGSKKSQSQYASAYLGQGGISTMPLYFSGQAFAGPSPLAPGGAGRSTMPGLLSSNGFKGRSLNRYGR